MLLVSVLHVLLTLCMFLAEAVCCIASWQLKLEVGIAYVLA